MSGNWDFLPAVAATLACEAFVSVGPNTLVIASGDGFDEFFVDAVTLRCQPFPASSRGAAS